MPEGGGEAIPVAGRAGLGPRHASRGDDELVSRYGSLPRPDGEPCVAAGDVLYGLSEGQPHAELPGLADEEVANVTGAVRDGEHAAVGLDLAAQAVAAKERSDRCGR